MNMLQKELKGIVLSISIGLIAYFSSAFLPSIFNSILLALILGMLLGNFITVPDAFQSGIGFTSSKMLELSILFLAFSINYSNIASLGWKSFSLIGLVVLIILLLTYYLAIKFKCPGSSGWLVGFGTAICGSSAIAALAPSTTENKDDIAISMAVVNLFGSLGMIVLPLVLVNFGLNQMQMGFLIGGSLHSVGNVAGAGYSMGSEVGLAAITIKLARVALLSPALLFFNYLVNKGNSKGNSFNLPWYLWSFIGITILTSLFPITKVILDVFETGGKVILTIAMAAVGLKVSFKKLFNSGKKGIVFGLFIFVFQLLLLSALVVFV
jgi:uncharacterized integral membrane protein (TIGR00698 family)